MNSGKLFLIPTAIASDSKDKIITPQLSDVLNSTNHFIAEHVREARRFISSLKLGIKIDDLNFQELDKHNPKSNISEMLAPALAGFDMGLLSDAGCPGVADPGAEIVKEAHLQGIKVVPLVGPSSILLGLMASGLSGQNFRFTGYLPIDKKDLKNKLHELEAHSRKHNETQIFIETPYRSDKLLAQLLETLHPQTQLSIAINVTGKNEQIHSYSIAEWQKVKLRIGKIPTVFLFLG